jgi:hypothetical protein
MLDQKQMDEWDQYPSSPTARAADPGYTLVIHDDAQCALDYARSLGLDPARTSTMPTGAPLVTGTFDTILIALGCTNLSDRTLSMLPFLLKAGGEIDDRRALTAIH